MKLSAQEIGVNNFVRDIQDQADLLQLEGISFREFLEAHQRYPVIAVTGQSGVGKSVFTELLASSLGNFPVKIYTELPQLSPYLAIIKACRDNLSDRQLWLKNQYLFLSLDQAIITQAHLAARKAVVVLDFALTQVKIYGDLTLQGQIGQQFRRDFDQSFAALPQPDLVIHLSAESDTVLKRLQGRGTFIDDQILKMTATLNQRYNQSGIIEESYRHVPILNIKTDQLDLVRNDDDQKQATAEAINLVKQAVAKL